MYRYIHFIALFASLAFPTMTYSSYMQSNKDKALEGKVHAVLIGLPINRSSFDVGVHRDEVLLVGMIESPALAKTVVNAVSAVPGVLRVHNELKSAPRSDKSYDLTMAKQLDLVVENSGIAGPQRIAAYVIEGGLYLMGPVTESEGNKVVKAVVAWSSSHPELKKIVKLFVYWKEVPGLVSIKGCQIYIMDSAIGKSEKVSWDGRCVKGIAEGQGVITLVKGGENVKGEGVFEHGSLVRGTLKYQRGAESFVYNGGIFNLLPQGPGTAKIESADVSAEVVGTFDEGEIENWKTATNLKTGEVRRFGESRAVVATTEPDSGSGDESSGIGNIIGGLLQGAGQAMQSMGGTQYGKGVLIEGIGGAVAGDEDVANKSMQSLNSGRASATYGQGLVSAESKKENCRYTPSGSIRGCVVPSLNHCIKVRPGRDGQAERFNGCSEPISLYVCSSGQGQRSSNAVSPLCSSLVNPSNSNAIAEPLNYPIDPGRSIPISGSSVTWACPPGRTDVLGWDGRTLQTVCYEAGLQTDSR
ncbi:Osmotically-inducible protein OsmY, contains BON domain [Pseudomonas sp. IT-P171]|uniref:BON domain-containing protein n=1 Tax=Pseudomonas sp. IT-P171 TaxID=3026453 RepID=UPI0039E04D53